jgi:o-succinylbenzoate---CoA ligase
MCRINLTTVTSRPLHAVLLPPAPGGGRLLAALAAALDGSGPAILPLNPALPATRLRELLDAFAPAAVETPDGTRPFAAETATGAAGGLALTRDVEPDIAVVVATSGSTGAPKGVALTVAALRASAAASLTRIGARPGQRWLCCLPCFHVAGLQVLVRSLLAGADPVVSDRADAATVTAAADAGCAHVSLVPTQLRRLLDTRAPLAAFETILLGGAAPPPGLLTDARAAGGRVVTTYGMSETCGGCVYDGLPLDGVRLRIGAPDPESTAAAPASAAVGPGSRADGPGSRADGPGSRADGPGSRADGPGSRADGPGSRAAGPANIVGRIGIAGPVLLSGYWPRGSRPAVDADGWFWTSDLGELGSDGHLTVRGRADDVINTGGEKVVPGQVEAILGTIDGVRDVVVIGVPDTEWGEVVTAVIVPADPAAPPDLARLRDRARDSLPGYAAPRRLLVMAEIPVLPSGKPDRLALRRAGKRQHS